MQHRWLYELYALHHGAAEEWRGVEGMDNVSVWLGKGMCTLRNLTTSVAVSGAAGAPAVARACVATTSVEVSRGAVGDNEAVPKLLRLCGPPSSDALSSFSESSPATTDSCMETFMGVSVMRLSGVTTPLPLPLERLPRLTSKGVRAPAVGTVLPVVDADAAGCWGAAAAGVAAAATCCCYSWGPR